MGKINLVTKACGVLLLWAATAVGLPAQTTAVSSGPPVFTRLFNFSGADGNTPYGLVQAADGSLYGTTAYGGTNTSCGGNGCGTVFKIALSGALTSLHSFDGTEDASGSLPTAALVQGTDGNLYGTTFAGGADSGCTSLHVVGCGTVFKITPSSTLTTLHSFAGYPTDGAYPEAGLVEGADGSFYGTTYYGGENVCYGNADGCGTIFKITPNGTFTTFYKFDGTDGLNPNAGLVQGTDGNFYGTTEFGGGEGCESYGGCGTVFKITPGGALTTLYSFGSESGDGHEPEGGLVQGNDGDFYGTTFYGGANNNGSVFKITPSGALTTLYSFDFTDGFGPTATLILGTDGNFYGTTSMGGASDCTMYYYEGCGTVFVISPSGALTTLHNFDFGEGSDPYTALLQDTNGIFYGTTAQTQAGAYAGGTVFSLSVGLGPFVTTNPAAGKVGATVGILGTNMTGATGVKFNGNETAFRVVSSTFIEAKVPSGATTGMVQVKLPGGTLSSNVPFIVLR